MFAVVDIAGFQEKVSEGDTLRVPLLRAEEGKSVSFDTVLLLAKSGDDVKVGTPYVSGAAVEVKVLRHGRDQKIRVCKMQRRKRYRRTYGHRQGCTEVVVTKIRTESGAASPSSAKKATTERKKVVKGESSSSGGKK